MTDKKLQQDIAAEIDQAIAGVKLEKVDLFRPISHSDMTYLYDRYPFLQIIDMAPEPTVESEVQFITADSGWVVHYYGDAMSASPGQYLYGGGDYSFKTYQQLLDEEDEGGEGGDIINPGKGTVRNQAFMTAQFMVALAKQRNWAGIGIIDGHALMKWAAWAEAVEQQLAVQGFTSTQREEQRRKRLRRTWAELEVVTGFKIR